MSLPAFYAQAPRMQLHDALAELLGAAPGGLIEYGYADVVRLAGHSCPTVAGAWLMACAALRALYPDSVAERGGIEVTMHAAEDEGTTGVIAQVFTLLTGAAANNGFHGIGGRFRRRGLLHYAPGQRSSIAAFRRRDSGAQVEVWFDMSSMPAMPGMRGCMARALAADADATDRASFAAMWSERVKRLLLDHADDPNVIRVRRMQ